MHGESEAFYNILILMGTSALLITFFYRLKIAPLLAFLMVGVLYGPTGLGIIEEPDDLTAIAELGLTFLLFILGLEFSLPRLMALRQTVFKLGSAQVFLCSSVFFIAFIWWGLSWQAALVVSGGLSLSSTAIVSKELSTLGQLNTRHGEIAIGILLFQDLVAVVLLIAVPILAGQENDAAPQEIFRTIVESILLLAAFFLATRHLLPRLLAEVASHNSDELLVLTALVIVLLSGALTSFIGLSMELGAFIAGMMLGDSRFKHQLEADIRPFRDLLLGLFFVTIGMLVDLELLREYWFRILISGIGLVFFKAIIISLLAKAVGESWRSALPAGLALAQGGEFLFALMALSTRSDLVPQDVASFLISMTIVSMVLTPVIIRHGPKLIDSAFLRIPSIALEDTTDCHAIHEIHKKDHVVILGFGRVGQTIARFLKPLDIDYLVLETDHIRINEAAAAGEPIYYGDSSRLDILKAAGVHKAHIVIISFDDVEVAVKILQHIRQLNPDVPVLTRTRDDTHLERLSALGSTEVIPETHEASLTLVSHLLLMLNIPTRDIHRMIDTARMDRYQMLSGFYHGERIGFLGKNMQKARVMHAVRLTGLAWACGRQFNDLLIPLGLKIHELHRNNKVIKNADLPGTTLQRGDVVILRGYMDEIDIGEAYLLRGK